MHFRNRSQQAIRLSATAIILWATITAKTVQGNDPETLANYIRIEDEAFGFELIDQRNLAFGKIYTLQLTSQTWRGHDWQHWLTIISPDQPRFEDGAILLIEGGSRQSQPIAGNLASNLDVMTEELIASQVSTPIAILQQVPNQPMFSGLREDALIAKTLDRYLQDGDEDWPLLLPMTKSAVRAMDAIQLFLAEKENLEIRRFIIGGGSKRGWTSYLAAASDPRVAGLVPLVIDMLNLPSHLTLQKKSYGKYSHMIGDYEKLGLLAQMQEQAGQRLAEMIDPYSYREQLTMPKLIILGTNDPYWVVDAANLYFPNLPNPKYLHYGVNVGHSAKMESIPTLLAFFHAVFSEQPLPELNWESNHNGSMTVSWQEAGASARLVQASSPTRDFRRAQWRQTRLPSDNRQVEIEIDQPDEGYLAFFVEVSFHGHNKTNFPFPTPLKLSTTIKVLPENFPFSADGTPTP